MALLGKQQLLQWAQDATSIEPCSKYDDMKDGFIFLGLFLHVFPNAARGEASQVLELCLKAAASASSSNPLLAQRSKQAWDCVRRIAGLLKLPRNLFDWRALQAGTPRNTYNLLVMLYFLSKLTETTDFSVDFAHPIDDNLSAFLQSPRSLEVLLRAGCTLPAALMGGNDSEAASNAMLNASASSTKQNGTGKHPPRSTPYANSHSSESARSSGTTAHSQPPTPRMDHHITHAHENGGTPPDSSPPQLNPSSATQPRRSVSPMPPVSTPEHQLKQSTRQGATSAYDTMHGSSSAQQQRQHEDDEEQITNEHSNNGHDSHRRGSGRQTPVGGASSVTGYPLPPASSTTSTATVDEGQHGASSVRSSRGSRAGATRTPTQKTAGFVWPTHIDAETGTTALAQLKARLASSQQECEMLRQQLEIEKQVLVHHQTATESRKKIEEALHQQQMTDLESQLQMLHQQALSQAHFQTFTELRRALAETEAVRELASLHQSQQHQQQDGGVATEEAAAIAAADKEARILLTAQVETLNSTLAESDRVSAVLRQQVKESTDRLAVVAGNIDETTESLVRNIEYDLGEPTRALSPDEACVIRALDQVHPDDRVAILTYLRQLRLQLAAARIGSSTVDTTKKSMRSPTNGAPGGRDSSGGANESSSSKYDVWPRKEVIVVEQSVALERAHRKTEQLERANTYLRETVSRLMAHEPALSEAAERDYGAQLLSEIGGMSIEVPSTVIKSIPIDTLCAQTHSTLTSLHDGMVRNFPHHECTKAADQLTTRFWCLTGALCALQRRLETAAQTIRHLHREAAESSRSFSVMNFNHRRELMTVRRDLEEQLMTQSREFEVREAGLQLRIQMSEDAKATLTNELAATQKRGEANCAAVLADVELFQNGQPLQHLSRQLREVTAELQSTVEGNRQQEETITQLQGQVQQLQQQLRTNHASMASAERRVEELEKETEETGRSLATAHSDCQSLKLVTISQRKELESYAENLNNIFFHHNNNNNNDQHNTTTHSNRDNGSYRSSPLLSTILSNRGGQPHHQPHSHSSSKHTQQRSRSSSPYLSPQQGGGDVQFSRSPPAYTQPISVEEILRATTAALTTAAGAATGTTQSHNNNHNNYNNNTHTNNVHNAQYSTSSPPSTTGRTTYFSSSSSSSSSSGGQGNASASSGSGGGRNTSPFGRVPSASPSRIEAIMSAYTAAASSSSSSPQFGTNNNNNTTTSSNKNDTNNHNNNNSQSTSYTSHVISNSSNPAPVISVSDYRAASVSPQPKPTGEEERQHSATKLASAPRSSSSSSPSQQSRSSSVSTLTKEELEKRKQEILAKYGVS